MNLSVLDDKELKHLLCSIKKANIERSEGEPLLEFALVAKTPKGNRELVQIVTGTVPASFRYTAPRPTRSRRSG